MSISVSDIEEMDTKLRDNGVVSWEYSQDGGRLYVKFTLANSSEKSISFTKVDNEHLSDKDLDRLCTARVINYLKQFSKAELRVMFTNRRWLVRNWDRIWMTTTLEEKLQSLEDDGYEIHSVIDGYIIARVK